MELFSRETIGNFTSDPYAKNDNKYSKEMQEIRKEFRKLHQETKKDGGSNIRKLKNQKKTLLL